MQPIYLSKSLATPSSNGLGSISTAASPVVTLNTSAMDTGRRVVFTSTSDASTLTLTFSGKGEGGTLIYSEAVKGSTASGLLATTLSDFSQLTSVTYSSAPNIPILIGTSSVGGTTWRVADIYKNARTSIGAGIIFSSTANGMTGTIDMTLDDFTRVYPNPYFTVPQVWTSTAPTNAASSNSWGTPNVDGNALVPIAGYRLTITSTAGTSSTVYATVLQSG